MPDGTSRERLVDAAFALFAERGFESTTVDEIAERAGVGRTTYFRNFPTKEDVIFPDHDRMVEAVEERLATATGATVQVAVVEAARLVLERYLAEGERARQRYALIVAVPALRDREKASVQRYQRVFRDFLADRTGSKPTPLPPRMHAELVANAVVTAHNHVLRRWLRAETDSPGEELDEALAVVLALFGDGSASGPRDRAAVLVVRTRKDLDSMLPQIRRMLR